MKLINTTVVSVLALGMSATQAMANNKANIEVTPHAVDAQSERSFSTIKPIDSLRAPNRVMGEYIVTFQPGTKVQTFPFVHFVVVGISEQRKLLRFFGE